jgi:hypothetical protein
MEYKACARNFGQTPKKPHWTTSQMKSTKKITEQASQKKRCTTAGALNTVESSFQHAVKIDAMHPHRAPSME